VSDYHKAPGAKLDFDFDWSGWLADGEAIIDRPVTIVPDGSGLTLVNTEAGLGRVKVWLEGGNLGMEYRVVCNIETDQGRKDSRSFTVLVRNR
jgi:hypothetical protein